MWPLILVTVLLAAVGILFIHRTGIAKTLRIIGMMFYSAGNAVDHWKTNFKTLREENC